MTKGIYIHTGLIIKGCVVEVWLSNAHRTDGKYDFSHDFTSAQLLTVKEAQAVLDYFIAHKNENRAITNMHFHTEYEMAENAKSFTPKHIRELLKI